MTDHSSESFMLLLHRWGKGDQQALDKLVALVYTEMNRFGHQLLQQERPDHTLEAADLVHEAYLRLLELDNFHCHGQKHFFTVFAGVMRRILVDLARARTAFKRGGDWQRIEMDESLISGRSHQINVDLLALDEALKRLSDKDALQAQIVELRYFCGITIEEIADLLEMSPAMVKRKWALARSRLYRDLYPVAA